MREFGGNAPIVLFVYNRLEHTKKTIEALKRATLAEETDLYIYSDGPKAGQENSVKVLREYLREINGFRNVKVTERKENWGLARSVIAGVTDVVSEYGRVIVMEDDIICAEHFLIYMNAALNEYENKKNIFSVSAYSYLKDKYKEDIPETYFLDIICSWGWATWKDRWELFDAEAKGYQRLRWDMLLRRRFNFDGTVNYHKMLMAQMYSQKNIQKRKVDSWAIRWYWTCFKQKGLNLYPKDSYVSNIGFDGSGTHNENREEKISLINKATFNGEIEFPNELEEKGWIRNRVKASLRDV